MKHTSGLSPVLAVMWVLSACATLESRAKEDLSEGYTLLYDLVSKEKQASQLSLVKTISPEQELETLARVDPQLNLKATHLPRIERDTHESIDKKTTQQIFRGTGVALEFNMVSSQLPAMNYVAHLAHSLAVVKANPRRKEFLQQTDRTFSELHGQVYKMLFTR